MNLTNYKHITSNSKKVNLNVSMKDSSGKESTSNIDIYVMPNRLSKKKEERLISKVKVYFYEK